MARFPYDTAAGAGVGVVPQRSIPVHVESTLRRTQEHTPMTSDVHAFTEHHRRRESYLRHVRGQLWADEASVVVVDGGVDAWYHHWPGRRLTRDGWVMAHVAVV